jgi:hypothetical protein
VSTMECSQGRHQPERAGHLPANSGHLPAAFDDAHISCQLSALSVQVYLTIEVTENFYKILGDLRALCG